MSFCRRHSHKFAQRRPPSSRPLSRHPQSCGAIRRRNFSNRNRLFPGHVSDETLPRSCHPFSAASMPIFSIGTAPFRVFFFLLTAFTKKVKKQQIQASFSIFSNKINFKIHGWRPIFVLAAFLLMDFSRQAPLFTACTVRRVHTPARSGPPGCRYRWICSPLSCWRRWSNPAGGTCGSWC